MSAFSPAGLCIWAVTITITTAVSPPRGGVFSKVEGQGSVLNLSFRAASDVEKQGNQAQKIKTSKIR